MCGASASFAYGSGGSSKAMALLLSRWRRIAGGGGSQARIGCGVPRPRRFLATFAALVAGCTSDRVDVGDGPRPEAEDVALEAGAQDLYEGQFQRGRGCTAGDLDLDGDPDLVLANPTDASRVLLNVSTPGKLRFVAGPVLHET